MKRNFTSGIILLIVMDTLNENLKTVISALSEKHGAVSFSGMPLGGSDWEKNLKILEENFSQKKIADYPEYIKRSLDERQNPLKFLPWAKSFFIFAFPFSALPQCAGDIKRTDEEWKSGLVSGYALRKDYHIQGEESIRSIASNLEFLTGRTFRYSYSVDTKPVSEKTLGLISGLGRYGYNHCLRCGNIGSGSYLATLFTDIEMKHDIQSDNVPPDNCKTCMGCVRNCPTGSLSGNSFDIRNCISYICGEKRGELSEHESSIMREWIFGCGLCVTNCPGSLMPEPEKIDLEWLLMSSSSEIKKAIAGTPLEHAGLTLLRRNAIYALSRKNDRRATRLITEFEKKQSSQLLKNIIQKLSVNL